MKKSVNFRLAGEKHDALSQIAAQTNMSVAALCACGVDWVIEEVKRTGQVPVPQVKLEQREEVAA